MDHTIVISVIKDLGFPIAMVIALFWKVHQQDKQHQEQISTMVEAINNNTNVLTRLCTKMGD